MSKQLCIPSLGDTFTLAESWTFVVQNDRRNETIVVWAGKKQTPPAGEYWSGRPLGDERPRYFGEGAWTPKHSITVTLPTGTILKIERIYIRKGAKEFDSVTFISPNTKVKINKTGSYSENKSLRFFASLSDVNKMRVV